MSLGAGQDKREYPEPTSELGFKEPEPRTGFPSGTQKAKGCSQSSLYRVKDPEGRKEWPIVGAVGTPLEIAQSKAQHLELGGRESEPEHREGSRGCYRHLGTPTSCLTGRADQVRADDRHRKMTGRGQAM